MLSILRKQCSPLILQICRFSFSRVNDHLREINKKIFCKSLLEPFSPTLNRSFSDTSTPSITNINSDQLKKLIELNKSLIIDVRTKEEITATGMIPTSYNIPLDELITAFKLSPEEFLEKYSTNKPNTDQNIVFSCAKGIRSLKACHYVADLGFKNLSNYAEGWFGWETQN